MRQAQLWCIELTLGDVTPGGVEDDGDLSTASEREGLSSRSAAVNSLWGPWRGCGGCEGELVLCYNQTAIVRHHLYVADHGYALVHDCVTYANGGRVNSADVLVVVTWGTHCHPLSIIIRRLRET